MIRVGVLGLSEGNGHPFSFSAIINGFSDAGLAASGWPVIHEYVKRRHASEFGIPDLRVTHAWTQDADITERLCKACKIEHAVANSTRMIGVVDAIILARDDHEQHRELAAPFLEAGLPVLVDKPLTLSPGDLAYFIPYLQRGQLMSCSAMRFAAELDAARAELDSYGNISLIRGAVLNDWAKYGIHLLDAIFPLLRSRPLSVTPHTAPHESVAITMADGALVLIDALGTIPKTFRVDVFGAKRVSHHEIADNFTMFRRMLWQFAEMIRSHLPTIPVNQTLDVLRVLMAGHKAIQEKRTVMLDELSV